MASDLSRAGPVERDIEQVFYYFDVAIINRSRVLLLVLNYIDGKSLWNYIFLSVESYGRIVHLGFLRLEKIAS